MTGLAGRCATRVLAALGLLGLLCVAGAPRRARAHAAQVRRVVATPEGAHIALDVPGFGVVLRPGADAPWVYLCDALLGRAPATDVTPMAFVAGPRLLVAARGGVAMVDADGCPAVRGAPAEGLPRDAPPALGLVAEGQAGGVAYAVVAGAAAAGGQDDLALWASDDAGRSWRRRAELPAPVPERVTGMSVSGAQGRVVHASAVAAGASYLLASTDAGGQLQVFPQATALILRAGPTLGATGLWGSTGDPDGVGNRGTLILQSEGAAGPWVQRLRVDYFGGLAVDAQGVTWVGDELGGIHRVAPDAADFAQLAPAVAAVDLFAVSGGVLAASSGAADAAALWHLPPGADGESAPVEVLRLTDVVALPSCPADDRVEQLCAGAWAEWERDVLAVPPQSPTGTTDAGTVQEAASDAGPAPAGSEGCAVRAGAQETSHGPLLLSFGALCLRGLGRRRRASS